ncbi:MAG: hypothetical protein CL579_15915 [Alteromonadaceae bacterium]|uniref:Uncharacterized protein n=1 Tax=Paraglaciecola mesophila KMM 241 TaxID=1128912 RepID=K6Z4I8_9ALTE|nr:hypothetical protein [Paraglaciecola mesophila]MAD17533.1 hypothetical protein [Alteromonadaceae bacterium]MBB20960.1 hypothetical protein [Rickettsiales bacterium]GAC23918.1 hypothetical protein GMES_1622 [Paraglaciecola mesophila KMM 241]|tara:strand:- start:8999 stop:9262 length:264 start_codon:yes stop_codon:yes gene_type:complete
MCSSPKSSGSRRPLSTSSKSLAESFSSDQRARFTQVANQAEQRRAERLATNKRWKQAQAEKANTLANNKKSEQSTSLFAWVSQVFAH